MHKKMREAIAIRQRGTKKTQKPEDHAHASIMHGRKSIKFGFFRRFLVFFDQINSLRD
jgi:hypothetical protein